MNLIPAKDVDQIRVDSGKQSSKGRLPWNRHVVGDDDFRFAHLLKNSLKRLPRLDVITADQTIISAPSEKSTIHITASEAEVPFVSMQADVDLRVSGGVRSEERRVGKKCRSRARPD